MAKVGILTVSCVSIVCGYFIGQQFDKNGNRVKWWTDASIRQFQNRTQCFVDQYDQYSLLGVEVMSVV